MRAFEVHLEHEGDAEPLRGGVEDQLAGIEMVDAAGSRPGRPTASRQ